MCAGLKAEVTWKVGEGSAEAGPQERQEDASPGFLFAGGET
jgi:hypothetical protein